MLKVGVFGVGHLGKYHLNNWMEIPEVKVIGFFDPSNYNAKEVEEKYGIPRYMDEEAFLHFGRTVWKYRAGTSGEEQPPSVLLLDDLTSHKDQEGVGRV